MKTGANRNILLVLAAALLYGAAVVLPALLWLAKLDVAQTLRDISLFVIFIAAAVYIAAAFLSIAAKSRDERKLNIRTQSEFFDNTYAYARRQHDKYFKKMKLVYALSRIYISLMPVLFYLAALGAFLYHLALIPLSILYFIAAVGLLMRMLPWREIRPESIALGEADFPVLYGILDRCKKKLGVTGVVKLAIIEEDNARVYCGRGHSVVSIGFTLVGFLSEGELEAVIMHEVAHIKHADTRRQRRYDSIKSILNSPPGRLFPIGADKPLLYWLASRYIPFFDLYDHSTSLAAETVADREVKALGDGREYINANAKLVFFAEFGAQPRTFNVYESESPVVNYFELQAAAFLKSCKRFRIEYERVCYNAVPPRRPTHPTLAERMADFGITGFNIDFGAEASDGFLRDRREVIARVDKKYYDVLVDGYEDRRKVNYLHFKELAEREEPEGDDSAALMRAVAAENICDYALAYSLYEKVLSHTPDNSLALLSKGLLMLAQYDDDGIKLVVEAVNLRNDYAEAGTTAVTGYLLRRGMAEQLESSRQWAIDTLQKKIDISYDNFDERKPGKWQENTVRPPARELIVRLASGSPCVSGVFAADKVSAGGYSVSYIGVWFARDFYDTDCEIFMSDLNIGLDTTREGDNYFTVILNVNPAMAHTIMSVPAAKLFAANDKTLDPFE